MFDKKEYMKQYNKKHKEKRKKQSKIYYQNNKKKIRCRQKKYYQEYKEKIKNRSAEYYQKNKEKIKEYKRHWSIQNPEYMKEYNKQRKEKTKHYNKDYYGGHKRQIIKKGKTIHRKNKNLWKNIIKDILGHSIVCQKCGYDKCFASIDFHHRNPKEKKYNIGILWRQKPTPERLQIFRKELKKCNILCKNCHYELHYPDNI